MLPLRLKHPPQPLVFCFSGVSQLFGAVSKLYELLPRAPSSLCLYRGGYFLALYAPLSQRVRAVRAAGEYGVCLGPGVVLYSFFEEHGQQIGPDVVARLGGALRHGGAGRGEV